MALSSATDAADVSIAVAKRSPFSSTVSAVMISTRLWLLGTLICIGEPGALGITTEVPLLLASGEAGDGS